MSTTPLTDAINALTTYSNETTGESDTTLSAAVATLVAGYGSGGGGSLSEMFNRTLSGSITIDVTDPLEYNQSTYLMYSYLFTFNTVVTSITINGYQSVPECFAKQATSLTSVSFPDAIGLGGNNQFYGCTSLTSASFPNVVTSYFNYAKLGNSMFRGCTSLTNVNLRNLDRAAENMFYGCSALTTLEFNAITYIYASAFARCSNLATLIIRSNNVPTLTDVNAFTGTPFGSGGSGGTIYVPSDLISSYQSASNWSTLHGYGTVTWTAIEGSTYETQYADGTAIS